MGPGRAFNTGDTMKSMLIVLAAAGGLLLAGGAGAGSEDLFKEKGCTKCHTPDADKKGPSLKKIGEKYKGNKDASAKLVAMVKEGKDDHPKPKATDDEIKQLVNYALTGK
jgi:cytochrome c